MCSCKEEMPFVEVKKYQTEEDKRLFGPANSRFDCAMCGQVLGWEGGNWEPHGVVDCLRQTREDLNTMVNGVYTDMRILQEEMETK